MISGGADKAARGTFPSGSIQNRRGEVRRRISYLSLASSSPLRPVFDVATGQTSQVAQHDEPIKCIRWIDAQGQGLLATGSWDKVRSFFWRKAGFQMYRNPPPLTLSFASLRPSNIGTSVRQQQSRASSSPSGVTVRPSLHPSLHPSPPLFR